MPVNLTDGKSALIERLRDPLFGNSMLLTLTSVSNVGFGFVFWVLAARLFQSEDVGVATVLISTMSLLVLLSRFGLDYSLIRFFPSNDRGVILGTSMAITTIGAIGFGIALVACAGILSDELRLLQNIETGLLFIAFVTANSVVAIAGNAYVACRKSSRFFIQSLVMGSRIALLFPLVCCDAIGIFGAVGLSFVLALLISIVFLRQIGVSPSFSIDRAYLLRSLRFSTGNYTASLFMAAPTLIMPLVVLNRLGAGDTAFYFVAYSVAALLLIIPNSTSLSLLVEGSHGEAMGRAIRKTLMMITPGVLLPALALFFVGDWVLSIFGTDYAESAFDLVRILVVANVVAGYVLVFYTVARVEKRVLSLVAVSAGISGSILILAYLFADIYGLIGIGYAWLSSYVFGGLLILLILARRQMQKVISPADPDNLIV